MLIRLLKKRGIQHRTRFAPAELLQLISGDIRVIYSNAPDLAWRHDTDTAQKAKKSIHTLDR